MTAPLTRQEIEDVKILSRLNRLPKCNEQRHMKERRKGEQNGSFSWSSVIDLFIVIVIAVGIAWTGFMLGRHYESVSKQEKVDQAVIVKEYRSFRVQGNH